MSKLMDRLKARSTIKEASLLNQSLVFDQVEPVMTSVPAINIALGGSLDGGLLPGMIQVTGPSKHFKSNMSLLMVSAYMKKYPESVCLFYDSEFGSKDSYFEAFGIDASRVLHVPITNLEQLKFDLVQQLDEFKKGDRVVIYIDSIGNLASKKEAEDALSGNQATDLSRAKFVKGMWRIVTPHLTLKQIPLIAINHIYMCGTENMQVMTPTGPVNLNKLNVGDLVHTTAGVEAVQNTFVYEDVPITEIELENGDVLEFTEFHKFRVGGEWISVSDLRPGMEIDEMPV